MATAYADSDGIIFTIHSTVWEELYYSETTMENPDYARKMQFDEITNQTLLEDLRSRMSDFTVDGSNILYDGGSPATVAAPTSFYVRFQDALLNFSNLMDGATPMTLEETQSVLWLITLRMVYLNMLVVPVF